MRRRDWYWPVGLVALLAASAGANIALVIITSRDTSFAVEPNYYAKALAWDQTMAQQARNDALGWALSLRIDPGDARGGKTVTVHLADRAGAPIEGAQVAVEAGGQRVERELDHREARARHDRDASGLHARYAILYIRDSSPSARDR